MNSFNTVKQATLKQTVWRTLREAILRGELEPGKPLNQASIAAQLGVSRGPLREALGLLEEEGLVRSVPYRGTFVADFDDRIIAETYGLRLLLEQYAAERAIASSDDEEMAELRSIYEEMVEAANEADLEKYHTLDLAFHRHLYVMADHELLLQTWLNLEKNVKRGIYFGQFQLYSPAELTESHRKILEAIEARDVEMAKREIDFHITDGCKRLTEHWKAVQDRTHSSEKG